MILNFLLKKKKLKDFRQQEIISFWLFLKELFFNLKAKIQLMKYFQKTKKIINLV